MPNIYSVVVYEDWIIPITPYLKEIVNQGTKQPNGVDKISAKECLEEFNNLSQIMEVMQISWGQASFTTKQMKILSTISAYLNLGPAERRFTV